MFSRQARFRKEEDDIRRSKGISEQQMSNAFEGLATGERLIEWGNAMKEKIRERAEQLKDEEERQMFAKVASRKKLSSSESKAVGDRLYRDMERLQLTRKHRLNKEKASLLIRESAALAQCTFQPKLLTKHRAEARYMSPGRIPSHEAPHEPQYTFVPHINPSHFYPPKEKNVYKRLYPSVELQRQGKSPTDATHDKRQVRETRQPPPEHLSSKAFRSFLHRQNMYMEHRKEHMEELKEMYDYPFTPMLSDNTRHITDKLASEPWLEHLDEQRRKRTKRVLQQQGLYQYGELITQLLAHEHNDVEINKALLQNQDSRRREAKAKAKATRPQPPPPSSSSPPPLLPPSPSADTNGHEDSQDEAVVSRRQAQEFFERSEQHRKELKFRNLRKRLESLLVEGAAQTTQSERRRTRSADGLETVASHHEPCTAAQTQTQHSKTTTSSSFDRRGQSAAHSSPPNGWNSSTLCDLSVNDRASSPERRGNSSSSSSKRMTTKRLKSWYKQQQGYSEKREQRILQLTHKHLRETFPFKAELSRREASTATGKLKVDDDRVQRTSSNTLSFLDRVKQSMAQTRQLLHGNNKTEEE